MQTDAAVKLLRDKLALYDRIPPGIGSGGEWNFDKEAVRVVLGELDKAMIDISDMLYKSTFVEDDICVWCKHWLHGACMASDCKEERWWRGPEPGGEGSK